MCVKIFCMRVPPFDCLCYTSQLQVPTFTMGQLLLSCVVLVFTKSELVKKIYMLLEAIVVDRCRTASRFCLLSPAEA